MTASATQTIKAILIDPVAKSVTAIDMPNDFERMKSDLIGCDLAQAVDLGEGITAWIDEEGLSRDWDEVGFTEFFGAMYPLAGRIVLTATNSEGGMSSLPMDIDPDLVQQIVLFPSPQSVQIPGPTMTTLDDDGIPVTVPLGSAVLTYENH